MVRRVDRVITLCVCAGRGDLLLAPILHVCLGKGQALTITVCVCEMEREIEILQSLI